MQPWEGSSPRLVPSCPPIPGFLSCARADMAQELLAHQCSVLYPSPGTRCCRSPRCHNLPHPGFPAWCGEGQPGHKGGGFCSPGAPRLSPQQAGADGALPLLSKPMSTQHRRAKPDGSPVASVPDPAGRPGQAAPPAAGWGQGQAWLTTARSAEPPRRRDTGNPGNCLPRCRARPHSTLLGVHTPGCTVPFRAEKQHRAQKGMPAAGQNPPDQPTCPRRRSKTFICSGDISYHVYSL